MSNAGIPQIEAAQEAIQAIFSKKKEVHRATFSSVNSEGKTKWILYEMWRAFVSCVDTTHHAAVPVWTFAQACILRLDTLALLQESLL